MLTDKELLAHLSALSQKQAEAESDIIAHLVEVERRSLHLKKAYRSLFEFVSKFLKCSEATASRRVAVTRAATKFPLVLDMIRTQRVTLTSLAMVAPHLSQGNHEDLLRKVAGVSKRETEKIVANFSAVKPKRDVIRPVAVSVPETPRTGESIAPNMGNADLPGENMLLDKTAPENKPEPRKKAQRKVDAPTKSMGIKVEARRPPAAIQREVWKRDEGQCTFTDHEGNRCSAKSRLQIDHIQPWALNGSSRDPYNLRLLCQAHNLYAAEKYFPAKREKVRAASLNN